VGRGKNKGSAEGEGCWGRGVYQGKIKNGCRGTGWGRRRGSHRRGRVPFKARAGGEVGQGRRNELLSYWEGKEERGIEQNKEKREGGTENGCTTYTTKRTPERSL